MDSMTEAADVQEAELTPRQAAETIEEARSYEEPLRRRTEGVTWMIWGLITAAIALSYSAVPTYYPGFEGVPWFAHGAITFGWPLVGVAMTYAAWRIAAVNTPSLEGRSLRSALSSALWLPLVYVGIGAVFLLGGEGVGEAAGVPIGIGLAWLTLGGLNPFRATATGRRVMLGVGALTLAGGLAFAPLSAGLPHEGYPAMRLVALALGGGAPFIGGLWQSLRG